MSKIKFLSIALVAAATLATPAMAREHTRHVARAAAVVAAPEQVYVGGPGCIPAPRVGAFASQPWTDGNVPCEPGTGYGYYGYGSY
ncbi:hypothetical protein I6F35_00780 [Bradyrhizobium sp. BRP22]|uniref:hypothetical protein n=1 Tax=Bradyrhizobium sp. BRP22 TaxID=2793821 RepID=UPI001CD32AC2|nr:hypothetical protein [Bradyrhizobium sp. BRP22]MCA1451745.1 hypothetical protein [Bradyrhizobium sp. BRP22]